MLSVNYLKWQDLLPELSLAIAKRLTSIGDFVSFRGVCRSWRSAATFDHFDTELPRLPYLMYLAEKGEGKSVLDEDEKGEGKSILDEGEVVEIWDNGEGKEEVVKMWDVDTRTLKITNFPPIYFFHPPLSCFGWILCVTTTSPDVSLRHFLLPISIKLPDKKPRDHISKMVLSGSPMKSDCVVMVICGSSDTLAFCRPGDESWTEIVEGVDPFFDIIYHNRKLYALDDLGTTIYECDIHGLNPTELVQVFAFDDIMRKLVYRQSYLVESRGKFLIVPRYNERHEFLVVPRYNERHDETVVKFRVFEIDLKDGSAEEIRDLGNRCLFLGTNSSICVEIPESSEVEPRRICFTYNDAVHLRPFEGVHRLWDGHFENLGIFGLTISDFDLHSWVVPSI